MSNSAAPARDRILRAAEELFAEMGYEATPTSKIAERAGVPKGLIHYYFQRKLDLLLALVERRQDTPIDPADFAVLGDPGLALRRLVDELDRRAERSAVQSRLLWREADTHHAVREALAARLDGVIALTRAVIIASLPPEAQVDDVDGIATMFAYATCYRQSVERHRGTGPGPEREGRPDRLRSFGTRGLDSAMNLIGDALVAACGPLGKAVKSRGRPATAAS